MIDPLKSKEIYSEQRSFLAAGWGVVLVVSINPHEHFTLLFSLERKSYVSVGVNLISAQCLMKKRCSVCVFDVSDFANMFMKPVNFRVQS